MFHWIETLVNGKTKVVPTWDILLFFNSLFGIVITIPIGTTLLMFSPSLDKEIIVDGELYCE